LSWTFTESVAKGFVLVYQNSTPYKSFISTCPYVTTVVALQFLYVWEKPRGVLNYI